MEKKKSVLAVVFVRRSLVLGAVVAMLAIACGGSTQPSNSPSNGAAGPTQAAVDQAKAVAGGFPDELTDFGKLGTKLGTQEAAFAFVRDQIAFEPYAGALKGAAGTLLTRGGNALDRALLLAALINAQGGKATLAHGQLPADKAKQLFDQLVAAPDALDLQAASLPPQRAPTTSGQDPDLQKKLLARNASAKQSVRDGYAALTKQLQGAKLPPATDTPAILTALQDHYWVTGAAGAVLDPSFHDAKPGQTFGTGASPVDPANVAGDAFGTVRFRLVAEHLGADGGLTPTVCLETTARFADLAGVDLRFALAPETRDVEHANAFVPMLAVGTNVTTGKSVQLHAGSAPAASSGGAGGLGGFGGGLSNLAPPPPSNDASGPAIGRLTLEITIHAPGRQDEKHRRIILDRVDAGSPAKLVPALADDATIRPLLIQIWEGVASVGPLTPPVVLRADAATVEAASMAAKAGSDIDKPGALPSRSTSSTLLNVLLMSEYARKAYLTPLAPHCRSFYQAGRLALLRHGHELVDLDRTTPKRKFRETIDFVNAPFAFACADGDPRALALEGGVADAAIELNARATLAILNTLPLSAAARAQNIPFFVASTPDALPAAAKADPIIARVFGDAFARGATVIGTSQPVALNQTKTFAWWEVGAGGSVVARAGWGGGQALTEKAPIDTQVVNVGKPYLEGFGSLMKCVATGANDAFVDYLQAGDDGEPVKTKNPSDVVNKCMINTVCGMLLSLALGSVGVGNAGVLAALANEERTLTQLVTSLAYAGGSSQIGNACTDYAMSGGGGG